MRAARAQTNLFEIDDENIGIYERTCLLEHSCSPNAAVTRQPGTPTLAVVATRAIPAGGRISFSYHNQDVYELLFWRRSTFSNLEKVEFDHSDARFAIAVKNKREPV